MRNIGMSDSVIAPTADAPVEPVRGRSRWLRLIPLLLLLAAVWYVYAPSRKHMPHSDQLNFLVDTVGHDDFLDLVTRTYSYNRTRITSPGDTQLFRPVFFVWLSGLKAAFGTRFHYPQTVGIVLHCVVCVLLFFLVRRIFALNRDPAQGQPIGLPLALTAFYGLNYSIVEQVVWFNIQPYTLAIALMLGSVLLLLRGTRLDANTGSWRLSLAAAWLLMLIASFTYELGQFLAILAGLFLMATLPATRRRRLAMGAAFCAIAVIYQGVNQFDHRMHDNYPDDIGVADVLRKATPAATLEHATRYAVYTLVQPFMPIDVAAHREGKIFIAEDIWYHMLHSDPRRLDRFWPLGVRVNPSDRQPLLRTPLNVAGFLVFLLWIGLTVVGFILLWRQRDWKILALAALLAGVWATYAAMTVFGRMNMRPGFATLASNTHYNYMALLWAIAVSAIGLSRLQAAKSSVIGVPMHRLSAILIAGLTGLGIVSGSTVHRLNVDLSTRFYDQRVWLSSLREFIEAHEHEPDFRFAVAHDPLGRMPQICWVPVPSIYYQQYADRERATYVLTFPDARFRGIPMEEWQQEEDHTRLMPDFIRPGQVYPIFKLDDWYYAPSLTQCRDYFRTAGSSLVAHRDRSLVELMEWIKAHTPPPQAAAH
jgi:hypothetical protein